MPFAAAASVIAAAVVVVVRVVAGGRIALGGGCVWDAQSYCAMAEGHRGDLPFSRRPLVPAVVRLLHFGSVQGRFVAVDLVSLAVAAIAVGSLTARLARSLGATAGRGQLAGVVVASATLAMPNMTHLALFLPALTDWGALALTAVWLLLFLSDDDRTRLASVPVACLAVAAREQVLVAVLAVAAVAFLLRDRRKRLVSVTAALGIVVAGFDFLLPSTGVDFAKPRTLAHYALDHVRSPAGIAATILNLAFAFGVFPLAALLARRHVAVATAGRRANLGVAAAVAVATANLGLALVGGSAVGRLATQGSPFLVAAVVAVLVAAGADTLLAGATIASIVVWRPWIALTPAVGSYLSAFSPQDRLSHAVALTAELVAVGVLTFVAIWRAGEQRDRPRRGRLLVTATS